MDLTPNDSPKSPPDPPAQVPASARVELELAILASDLAQAPQSRSEDAVTPQRATVFVVAADADLRSYVRLALERAEYRVLDAATSSRAALLGTGSHVSVVITADPTTLGDFPTTPAILLAEDDADDGVRPDGHSELAIIVGPFQPRQLIDRVERLVSKLPA